MRYIEWTVWVLLIVMEGLGCKGERSREETPLPSLSPRQQRGYSSKPQSGLFFDAHRDKTAPPLLVTHRIPPTPQGKAVMVHLRPRQRLRTISPLMFGNNAAVWIGDDYLFTPTFRQRLELISVSLLRWPGGSISDEYHFDRQPPPFIQNKIPPGYHGNWALDTGEFLSFTRDVGAQAMIVVNHGFTAYQRTSHDGTLDNAVNLAADWVEYCNAPNDGSNPRGGIDWAARRAEDGYPSPFDVPFFAVGNEVFGAWETGRTDGASYASNFVAIAQAMKTVDPGIAVGATATVNTETPGNIRWMKDFLSNPEAVAAVDFLELHNYFKYVHHGKTRLKSSDLPVFLNQVGDNMQEMKRLVRRVDPDREIPVFLGEYHLTQPRNKYNLVLGAGVFVAGILGEALRHDYAAAAFWNVVNEWTDGGDFGVMSRNHPWLPDNTPYVTYYPFYFYTRNVGDTLIATDQNDWNINVYASTFSTGELGVIIVNLTDTPRRVTIDTGGGIDGYVNSWILSGPDLLGPQFSLNDIGRHQGEGGPLPSDDLAYFQDVGATDHLETACPAYSVVSLVIY